MKTKLKTETLGWLMLLLALVALDSCASLRHSQAPQTPSQQLVGSWRYVSMELEQAGIPNAASQLAQAKTELERQRPGYLFRADGTGQRLTQGRRDNFIWTFHQASMTLNLRMADGSQVALPIASLNSTQMALRQSVGSTKVKIRFEKTDSI